ncbi:MAG: recombinase family protein [Alphaproteobacteria bacterium]|nr:recombinase family protein [Alphaproteobacteria bacterium]
MNSENLKELQKDNISTEIESETDICKPWGSAIILATEPKTQREGEGIEYQLSRTSWYCCVNCWDVWRVYIVDDLTGTVPFYRMINYIKRADYPVYIIVDSSDHLFLDDFNKVALLNYFYHKKKIQIHLVTEEIVLQNPYSKKEQEIWEKLTRIPKNMLSGMNKGIEAYMQLEHEREKDESNAELVQ